MPESVSYLVSGCMFGLAAGISPGPLMALVVSETLRHGRRAGVLVASAPLVTDVPIIALSLYVLARLVDFRPVLGMIALLGAAFIAYMAFGALLAEGGVHQETDDSSRPMLKGVTVNALSPHPYLFWISVGGPMVMKASWAGYVPAAAFVAGFYACLVGSKVAVALLVERSKGFLHGAYYVYILRALGAALFIFAALFFREGLRLLFSMFIPQVG